MKTVWQRLHFLYFHTHGRAARPASLLFNAAKTFVQALAMGLLFLWLGCWLLWHLESALMNLFGATWRHETAFCRGAGIVIFGLGWALAWTSAAFIVARGQGTPLPLDCPRHLVVAGPYRWVRNPMAVGSLLQGSGVALWFASPLMLIYVVLGMLAWNIIARPWEERDLRKRFGAQFCHYQAQVRCWIPRYQPYQSPPP